MNDNDVWDGHLCNQDDGRFGWYSAGEMAATGTTDGTLPAPEHSDPDLIPPEQPNWDTWSDDPFSLIQVPFGALLEPEGYAVMRGLGQRRTTSYAARMPRTYAVAQAMYDSVVVRGVWGRHLRPTKGIAKKDEHGRSRLDVTWLTHTAGRWIEKKNRKEGSETGQAKVDASDEKKGGDGFPDSPLVLLDVIKTLADPDAHAVGNKDVWDWRRPHLMVRNVRIDIDLNRVFERCDLADRRGCPTAGGRGARPNQVCPRRAYPRGPPGDRPRRIAHRARTPH